eukprot:6470357-Amphidinium_carterae.2
MGTLAVGLVPICSENRSDVSCTHTHTLHVRLSKAAASVKQLRSSGAASSWPSECKRQRATKMRLIMSMTLNPTRTLNRPKPCKQNVKKKKDEGQHLLYHQDTGSKH